MKKLNAGCGNKILDGYVNMDNADMPNVDVKHNLLKFPYPFKDSEFDEILVSHVLEHFEVEQIIKIMDEFHRILNKNGILHIKVPYYNSPSAISPLDHKTFYTFGSMDYFLGNNYTEKASDIKIWNKLSEKGKPSFFGRLIPNIVIKKITKKAWKSIEKRKITLREFLSHIFGYIILEIEYKLTPNKEKNTYKQDREIRLDDATYLNEKGEIIT